MRFWFKHKRTLAFLRVAVLRSGNSNFHTCARTAKIRLSFPQSGADPPGATGGAEEDAEPLDPAAEAAHKLGSGAHCQADFEITEMPDMSLGAAPGVASNKTPNGHSRLATPAPSKASSSKKLKFPSIFPKKKEIAK